MIIYVMNTEDIPYNQVEQLENSDYLEEYRKNKIKNKKNISDRKLSIAAGLLIWKALGLNGVPKDKITKSIFRDNNGKPQIQGFDLNISVSHSHNYALVVVDEKPVGVDVELERLISPKLIKRCFSKSEKDYLTLTDNKNLSAVKIWTCKESYLKMTGQGIRTDLEKIDSMYRGENFYYDDSLKVYYGCQRISGYLVSVCSPEKIENIEFVRVSAKEFV